MPNFLRIDTASGTVINREVWADDPDADGFEFVPDEGQADIGWSYADGVFSPPESIIDRDALKAEALARAHAYGNAITAQITSAYAQAEILSWDAQEREARMVLADENLPPEALLTGLAQDAGRELAEYAAGVIAKANSFRQIARAAVLLRRAATAAIMDPAVTTPDQLDAAVAELRAQADTLAGQLIG